MKCRHCWGWSAPSSGKNGDNPWVWAVLAECATADAILSESLEQSRWSQKPLVIAALQSLLTHAAGRALKAAMPREAPSVVCAIYDQLAARSHLDPTDFLGVWGVVLQLLDRQPITAERAVTYWVRVVIEQQDAGFDITHLPDFLWVNYTSLVYPSFKVRVFEAAGGRRMQPRPTAEVVSNALAKAAIVFRTHVRELSERVLGDKLRDTGFRQLVGTVVAEKNLRAVNAGWSLVGGGQPTT